MKTISTILALGLISIIIVMPLIASTAVTPAFKNVPPEGVTVGSTPTITESEPETPAQHDARMNWWRKAKFGMFIHWGIYSVPAGKYGNETNYAEWIMNQAKISVAEYRGFAKQFNPVKYNPIAWSQIAKDAGMRYIIITAKHHDGFALYPSAASVWNVAEATPYKKDLLGPLVNAAKADDLKIGFYYSQSQDWNNPGGAKSGFNEGEGWDAAQKGDYDDYLKNIAAPQIRELLTRYSIDILWWDTPMFMDEKRAAPLAALIRLRPGLITNNRLGGGFNGDTSTPEQFVPISGYKGDWETCMTMNDCWGYNAYDQNWKSSADLIRKLAAVCSKGGNFLLNVGPTAEGEFPPASIERLRDIGRWMRANGDSIYGTSAGPFTYLSWGVATRKGNIIYLHVFDWPKGGQLHVPLQNKVKSVNLLCTPHAKLSLTNEPNRLVIHVPSLAPDAVDTVVALEIEGEPVVLSLPTVDATATASASMSGNEPANVLDGTVEKVWRAPAEFKSAWLEVRLAKPTTIGAFGFDEPDVWPRMTQQFTLEISDGNGWHKIAEGNTIGHGFRQIITPVTTQTFRLTIKYGQGSPGIAEFQLYRPE